MENITEKLLMQVLESNPNLFFSLILGNILICFALKYLLNFSYLMIKEGKSTRQSRKSGLIALYAGVITLFFFMMLSLVLAVKL